MARGAEGTSEATAMPQKHADRPKKVAVDPVEAAIKAKVKPMLVASFFLSACNTMSSILYVRSALEAAGSASGAAALLTFLHSFCAAVDIFGAPSFGALTDTLGRKRPLVLLSGSLCLSRLLMLFGQNKRLLSVSRVVGYVSASLFSNTLAASILDLTHDRPDLGPVNAAMNSSFKGWGVVVGPYLAGLVGKKDFGRGLLSSAKLPFLASAAFGGFACVWTSQMVPETLPVEERKPFKPKSKNIFGFLQLLGHHDQLNRVFLLAILGDIPARTAPIFAVATKTMFGWDTETTARWLLCYGLGMAFGPGLVAKRTVAAFGPRGAHYWDAIGITIAAGMLALSRKGKLFWSALGVYLFSLGVSSGFRAMQMHVATTILPDVGRGELTGRFSSIASISNMFSPQLYAAAFGMFTSKSAPFYFPGVPFAIASTSSLMYFLLLQTISTELWPWNTAKLKQIASSNEMRKIASNNSMRNSASNNALRKRR